ncbi:MAG: cob(I)yrinic acid a,c-diamide adenosyltransferase [Bdellovibrionales bacterium]|nr:cob(I)yrinic acid a,c-diamide adenosyltransferase [Bdellovibrionales bacterium]
MVKIGKIYTKTGDDGSTGLIGGRRISKSHIRVAAYGDVDELNSWCGFVRTLLDVSTYTDLSAQLEIVQNELFDLGSQLAVGVDDVPEGIPSLHPNQIHRLEKWIDAMTEKLPELRSFVLPGGTQLNATIHVARTVCRRAERQVVLLMDREHVEAEVPIYLNRLSDYFFALAREVLRREERPEYLWEPGKTKTCS